MHSFVNRIFSMLVPLKGLYWVYILFYMFFCVCITCEDSKSHYGNWTCVPVIVCRFFFMFLYTLYICPSIFSYATSNIISQIFFGKLPMWCIIVSSVQLFSFCLIHFVTFQLSLCLAVALTSCEVQLLCVCFLYTYASTSER